MGAAYHLPGSRRLVGRREEAWRAAAAAVAGLRGSGDEKWDECRPQHGPDTSQGSPGLKAALCLVFFPLSLFSEEGSISPELKFQENPMMLLGSLSG